MTADTTASASHAKPRAFVLLKSRRRLDLLNPDPHAWTDDDLAAGLSRTMRWGGASQWEHPLSVAQHSLTVLAIREAEGPLTPGEALRELLHDATEFMLGWDCITPLKAQLGEPFRALEARLQSAIDTRYRLPGMDARGLRDPQARRPPRRRVRSFPCRWLEPGRHAQDLAHRGSPAPRRSSFAVRFRALGALAPARRSEAVHRTVQCPQTAPINPQLRMITFPDLCPFPPLQGAEHHVES